MLAKADEMLSTDQSHLRKYLTTLGVAIAAGTLSLAGLFFKIEQDLLVARSTLKTLTPTGYDAIIKRQEYLAIGTAILPWFTLIGFCGGVAMAAYGMVGWASRQKVIDKREDIGLRRDEFELSNLTGAQIANKFDREAEESVAEPGGADAAEPVAEPGGADAAEPVAEHLVVRRASLSDARLKIIALENALRQKLSKIYEESSVTYNVMISLPDSSPPIDADAIVTVRGKAFIIEVKYASARNNVLNRIVDGLQQLARVAVSENVAGVLVIVIPNSTTAEQLSYFRREAVKLASVYRSAIKVYVDRYSHFLQLSAGEFAVRAGIDQPHRR